MMKSIRKGGISMLLLLGLAGCGKEIPSDIIQPSEMESLLYDYHLATTMGNDLPYGETYKKEAYLDYVFDKHHVTEAEFDSSMVWYTRHTYHLVTIYENVQKRFEEDEKHLRMRMSKVSCGFSVGGFSGCLAGSADMLALFRNMDEQIGFRPEGRYKFQAEGCIGVRSRLPVYAAA